MPCSISLSFQKMNAANLDDHQKLGNSFFTIDVNTYLQAETEEEEEDDMEESFDINLFTDSNMVFEKEDEPSSKSASSSVNANNQKKLAELLEENAFNFSQLGQASSSSFSSDFTSRRKILPVEPISKLQSPMTTLKPPPNVSIFFRTQKSVVAKKTEERDSKKSQKPEPKQKTEKVYSFRFYKKSSVRRNTEESLQQPLKRFPMEAMNKYIKLMKRFYMKASKFYSEKESLIQDPFPVSSQANKHFGKSKSWSRAISLSSPASERRDDSLLLHVEGIQSAIWHCKKSFDASRDSSSSSSSSTLFGDHPTSEHPRISTQEIFPGHKG